MLTTTNLSVYAGRGEGRKSLLKDVAFEASFGDLIAVIGPSGCGKSTFLKAIAGLAHRTEGQISWLNREIMGNYDIKPESLAYVPQFGVFHEELTVEEILTDATILRLGTRRGVRTRVAEIAELTGLSELLRQNAGVLSGGQKRRLALATELVSEPSIILADEATSGLDPKSSMEITELLYNLAAEKRKIVLHVTHELNYLHYYDAVIILVQGIVAFYGTPAEIFTYFQISELEEVFQRLSEAPAETWELAWREASKNRPFSVKTEEMGIDPCLSRQGAWARWPVQFLCLIRRRFRLFFRNKAQISLQLLLLFVFPGIVVLFALKGLPEVQNMSLSLETNPAHMLKESLDYSSQVGEVGRLVSGLAMFQVILLALMGVNNAAREIAAERVIFEKERLSGLSASCYLTSKIAFLALLVFTQSLWMTVLVKEICNLPGSFEDQFIVLGLVNLSLTVLSLAISSWSRTAEQASLIALYVVGFQLPLSGAVLALPDWLANATRPFIAAYWSWSGYLQTLKDTRLYDVMAFANSPVDTWSFSVLILMFQSFVSLVIAFLGCYRSSFDE